jgi:DNA-binding CsgD family transcriptional regulator
MVPVLVDRVVEAEAVAAVLAAAREGLSGVLVVRGEAGIGKTALLEHAVENAGDMRVAWVTGVESEMDLGFAGLHLLLVPFLGGVERLPGPQRAALQAAFGLAVGPAPDRFLVGLAALTLLTDAAAEQPVLCVVDDAQWLDTVSVEVLGFVARRLLADRVAMLFGVREQEGRPVVLVGLPEVRLGGLAEEAAGELLAASVGGPVDQRVGEQVVAGAAGNPLALVEFAGELTAEELSGAAPLAEPLRFGARLEELYRARVRALPGQAQLLLLLAAAEPAGDPVVLWRAAGQAGIDREAAEMPAVERLVMLAPRVRFRHPLMRSAAYYAAPAAARRRAHAVLAAASDPTLDPDRRAWHLAEAAAGPDEQVAVELERSAGRAQERGGLAAAAAFLERAAALTPGPAHRAARSLDAAQAKIQAGAFEAARKLLGRAESAPLDEFGRARADLLRAQLAFAANRGNDAPPLLLKAAKRLEPIDVDLARDTYLDALNAALNAGHLAHPGGNSQDVSRAARTAPRPPRPPRAPDLLLDGFAVHFTEGYAAAAPILRRALSAFDQETSAEVELRWLWLVAVAASHLWDYDRWDRLSRRHLQLTRDAGALSQLPGTLTMRAYVLFFAGELAAGTSLIEEAQVAREATGTSIPTYVAQHLAALRGREAEAAALASAAKEKAAVRGEGIGIRVTDWATAVLWNGLGRYDLALAAAEQASADPAEMVPANSALVELIEAADRAGSPERATAAMRRLAESTSVSGTDWGLGMEARSRALLSDGEDADRRYREAIERLGRTGMRAELARAHLLYGEWLRRKNRRTAARQQLRDAYQMLTAMGMDGFAERARRELLVIGETVRKRTAETLTDLTAQEAQIAKLARDGHTNQEIAAKLFVSASTVEYHLRKVYRKLGITRRAQLARASLQSEAAPVPDG